MRGVVPFVIRPPAVALVAFFASLAAGCPSDRSGPDRSAPRRAKPPEVVAERAATPVPRKVRLRVRHRLGVPLHPQPRSRRISGRIPGGTEVKILAERFDGHWLKVAAADGESGWIIRRYVDWSRSSYRPRQPALAKACELPDPGSRLTLRVGDLEAITAGPEGSAGAASGKKGRASPRRLTVASYNVWELYDGLGGDRYLSRRHARRLSPAAVQRRVERLAAQLRPVRPHVIAFQEIEDASMACRLARRVMPEARWRCGAGRWSRGSSPMNMAIAARLPGRFRALTPRARFAPRGAVEFQTLGGKLRVIGVHLKSSMGARGVRDCPNAVKRWAMARALTDYLDRHRAGAALVTGDFNVDPQAALHDRTGAVLAAAGLQSLRMRFYPRGAPATYPSYGGTIDLAFFRPASGIRAVGFRVLTSAVVDRQTSDHRPVTVTLAVQ